jgi:hypothetical protein
MQYTTHQKFHFQSAGTSYAFVNVHIRAPFIEIKTSNEHTFLFQESSPLCEQRFLILKSVRATQTLTVPRHCGKADKFPSPFTLVVFPAGSKTTCCNWRGREMLARRSAFTAQRWAAQLFFKSQPSLCSGAAVPRDCSRTEVCMGGE